ncbi:hypothetical protein [Staphylococcus pseudintermedius]|uniref:hypothetical protein n=1 Tax=Staphylococcus pseudintermedius TaxID=283734 RepID=UPI0035C02CCD
MKNTINDLFNYHFENDIKDKDNVINSVIKLKGLKDSPTPYQKDLAKHFKAIKKRYSTSLEFFTTEDMVQSYATAFLFSAQELEVLEDLDFLLNNPEVYQSRISYIKECINYDFYKIANPNTQKINTRDGYKYININAVSLDKKHGVGEDATNLINLIGDENSLFKKTESNHNHFVQWFLDNKEQILTKKQLETFNTLSTIYQAKMGNTKEDNRQRALMLQEAGLNNRNMKLLFKRIKERAVKAYEDEFNGIYHGHNYNNHKGLYDVMVEYTESADFPAWNTVEDRQIELTKIIQKYYDTYEEFELTIIKGLTTDEKIEIVRGVKGKSLITHKVLRKINNNIKEYLKNNKPLNIKASFPTFDYKENIYEGLSKLPENNLMITMQGVVPSETQTI